MGKIKICIIIGMIISLVGCSTIKSIRIPEEKSLSWVKTAYVAKHPKSKNSIDVYIQEALAERGLQVKTGPDDKIPEDVDIYVKYVDRWQWDMAMYLLSLKIIVYDGKTNVLIKLAEYKNAVFHSFPDPSVKTKQVVDLIFKE